MIIISGGGADGQGIVLVVVCIEESRACGGAGSSSEDPLLASRINTLGNDGHVLHILLRGITTTKSVSK